jgi:hypothetical protein
MKLADSSTENPTERGLYVCWIDGDFPVQANRVLLLWENDRWEYQLSDQRFRGPVYQWLGPLPRLEIKQ